MKVVRLIDPRKIADGRTRDPFSAKYTVKKVLSDGRIQLEDGTIAAKSDLVEVTQSEDPNDNAMSVVPPASMVPLPSWADMEGLLVDKAKFWNLFPQTNYDSPDLKRIIALRQDDKDGVCSLAADAIVNAANSGLWGGGGVCGQIYSKCNAREAMDKFNREANHGHCEVGKCVLTPGYALPARVVIHAVGPKKGDRDDFDILRGLYWNILNTCQAYGFATVGIPMISTGVFGMDPKACSVIAVSTVCQWLESHRGKMDRVVFSAFTNEEYDIYKKVINFFLFGGTRMLIPRLPAPAPPSSGVVSPPSRGVRSISPVRTHIDPSPHEAAHIHVVPPPPAMASSSSAESIQPRGSFSAHVTQGICQTTSEFRIEDVPMDVLSFGKRVQYGKMYGSV